MTTHRTVIYTLGGHGPEWQQGARDGGVFVNATQDGNFVLQHALTALNTGLKLTQERFGKIFGRVPMRGLKMRADVFLRLCRLGGLSLVLADEKVEDQLFPPGPEDVFLFTTQEGISSADKVHALQYQPDGNFRLTSEFTHGEVTAGRGIPFDRFEAMFGLEPRDFFANEVLRISGLVGIHVEVTG